MSGYVCWAKDAELGVLEGEEEEEGNIDFMQFNSFADTLMGDADDEDSTDALAQMLHDAKEDCDNERDWKKLERITLELLQWKASNGVSNKGFNELLMLIKKLLPEGNKLPATTYEAKEVVWPLGLEVQKIHVCPNDCILYRGDYRELECCPMCKASRYKIKRDDLGDVEGERPRKRVPAKVMWYFPIISRLRRLFRNKEHAKIIWWHNEERKKDDMLRHPADGSHWWKIDRTYPDFAEDAKIIRFGLSTDGMNPFSEMINRPKQPGNDIDVYLQPLVEELLLLWTEGVCVWDAHKQEAFDIRALLQSNKGFRACVHCLDETDSTYLKHCRNVVYVGGHRRLLGGKHPARKKGKHFNGKEENRGKPIHRSGKVVFEMVKSLRVVFGKGLGSVPVPNENGKAPMWKKKSIFWDLPYWEVLDVRHAIDVMHVTKNLCVNLLGFLGTYGKNKDTLEAREDMVSLKGEQGHHYLGTASYTLSKREKESMFECLDSIKVPSGYSSNRYMAVLKKYVRNRSRPEGCIAKVYGTEEVIEFCTDYIDELKPIGVSLFRYEGRLAGKGTLGKKMAK
ncbi:hypothetical protein U9M48_008305 [Paspalum notatum var. saurae]|uniref:DUF4218 domain-containing protein n=1 Tax=Paspalum notatum var. saurae TaxID=547442 RepID=A0AAQ3SNN4_PASNO